MAKRKSPSEIIDQLGGTRAVKLMTGARNLSNVSNWRREGIPMRYWMALVRVSAGKLVYEDLENQAVRQKRKRAA